ncbi:hypothetical protein [Candidatus Frankia nodulisporulans]|uniref:hypothetical protein n=1 Tax=Candidatus Frankia nodulisporulans TaxID=2060052 RepID=UPI0013D17EB6|nr:hypothetical protein [Candidatus Frankia nodulisporulans]
MFRRKHVGAAVAGLMLLVSATSACAGGANQNTATGATVVPAATDAVGATTVTQHAYHLGESFTYLYDATGATYATEQAQNGQVPRVTDLKTISETRTLVRFSVVLQNGKLAKKFELLDVRYRDIAKGDTADGRPAVAFKPIQSLLPTFPATFSYTYPIGGDSDVARNLTTIFKDYPDTHLFQLVDIFTFPTSIAGIPATLKPGQVLAKPGVDVTLFGTTYHSGNNTLLFERVDRANRVNQAYFNSQTLGNYFASLGIESNVQMSFHVPLTGISTGLVSDGTLQETTYQGGLPRTATQRQVSIALQTADTRSAVDAYTQGLKPRSTAS